MSGPRGIVVFWSCVLFVVLLPTLACWSGELILDIDACYEKEFELDMSTFVPMASKPGAPHDTTNIEELKGIRIDSAFIGSCTNGSIEDLRAAASILEGRQVAPGVVLKIVPTRQLKYVQ